MAKTASLALGSKRVTALCRSRVLLFTCLAVLSAAMLTVVVMTFQSPRSLPGGRATAPSPEIPYPSRASVYRENAAYVTALHSGRLFADVDGGVADPTAPPSSQ